MNLNNLTYKKKKEKSRLEVKHIGLSLRSVLPSLTEGNKTNVLGTRVSPIQQG